MSKSQSSVVTTKKHILGFAREAGAAEALAPVIGKLNCSHDVLLLAKDFAERVFQARNLEYVTYPAHSHEALAVLIRDYWQGFMPDIVLTSATSLPWNDMTERRLWLWAREHSIPSLAVIDQWQNYGLRFSGCRPDERLAYLPTRITTLDERARQDMVSEGIPAELIVVTGQPAFDALFEERSAFTPSDRNAVRKRAGAEPDSFLVVFVSDAFKRDFGDSLGYNEASTLAFLIRLLSALAEETGLKLHLVVKYHPQNIDADFAGLELNPARLKLSVSIIRQEIRPRPLVLASDLVAGMTSILLVESILLGLPTISVTLNSKQDVDLLAVRVGAVPLLRAEDEAADAISRLIKDADFRVKWVERQKTLSVLPGATERVVLEVENLLGVGDSLSRNS